jgi:hypothetical protein
MFVVVHVVWWQCASIQRHVNAGTRTLPTADRMRCCVLAPTTLPGAIGRACEASVALRYDSKVLVSVEWGGSRMTLVAGESLNRSTELTSGFVNHGVALAGSQMSPGTPAAGSAWGERTD